MAIAEKLEYLNGTKSAIKSAIQNRGVTVSDTDTFREYATKIGDIGESVEKTKFGATIDSFLGSVDENGVYSIQTVPFVFNLMGVTTVPALGFIRKFDSNRSLQKIIANDVVSVDTGSFQHCCAGSAIEEFYMDGLEEVSASNVFYGCLATCSKLKIVSFKSLKRITGSQCFYGCLQSSPLAVGDISLIFPALEEITGSQAFNSFVSYTKNSVITFPSLKKITGGASIYTGTFGGMYTAGTVWNFPSAIELSGTVWNNVTYTGEIHFAAANQAAIEACDGYANKWGFTGATIYFDL